jgi:UDP-N-acetylmuramate--alanine ligase
MFFKPQHVHFTGIGGIGMSGLAEVLLNLGYRITGSDLRLTPITDRLQSLGATIFEGHSALNIEGAKAVVVTSAATPDNPEILAARRQGIPVIPRGELLAELMRLKYGIAIAGSHGKTTTTSMVATILGEAGLDPTVVVGGRVGTMGGSNARVGHSDFMVVESDESDGSFLKLSPIVIAVTNIDREHLDHYRDIDEIRDAFRDFVNKVPFYGAAIICLDDENVQRIMPQITRRVITYGASAQVEFQISDVNCGHLMSEFNLRRGDNRLGRFRLNVPGYHNVLNATAAVAIAIWLEVPLEKISQALATFSGVDRRFQTRGQERGVTVIDDYGHHPTEIRATLAAARLCNFRRVMAIFQPHRYTRTQALMEEFARSFNQADAVFLVDIYPASEKPIEGVTSTALAQKLRDYGHRNARYAGTIEHAVQAVLREVQGGDMVITLGAGNVWQAGDKILQALREVDDAA